MAASRRSFLVAGTAGAAVAASPFGGSPAVAAAAAPRTDLYDFHAIAARLARPALHRQVFATNRVADGIVVGYMRHSMEAYETAYGDGPGAMHAAAVFYGRGVVLGMNDTMWRSYRLVESVKRRGDVLTDSQPVGNPFTADFAELSNRGASFFVCDNAVRDWATYLVTTAGFNDRTIESVVGDLRSNLIASALLVPAGVAALNQAQEARFTYLQASL